MTRIYNRSFRAESIGGNPIAGAQVTLWDAKTGGTQITDGITDLSGSPIPGGILTCDGWGFTPDFQDTMDRPDVWAIGSLTGTITGVERVLLESSSDDGRITSLESYTQGPGGLNDRLSAVEAGGGGGGGGVIIAGDLGGTNASPQVIGTHLASALPLAQGGTAAATAPAARTSLGLGGAAVLSVGTAAGTVAAGDDSRLVGAAQKASNLSDLASASAARTSLGLGGAALLGVGTTTGTVAAGDDARLSNARTPTSHASTHATAGSDPVTPSTIGAATDHGYSPADYGLAAWVGDPGYISGAIAVTGGILHLMRVKIPQAITINNIVLQVSGAPSLTAGQNFAALIDASGNRVGLTADQTTAWSTSGSKICALAAPYAAPAGYVYVAALFNGTSFPNMGRYATSTQYPNANLSLTALRFAQYGSGLTAIPSTITMSSIGINLTAGFWAAVS